MFRVLSLLLCASLFISTQQKEFRISWKENKPLKWSDFKASADKASAYTATANTGISHKFSITGKGIFDKNSSRVTANFYPNLSWYKPNLIDEYTLQHEQAHFDISEFHARLLRKAIAEYHFTRNSKNEITRIYKKIEASRKAMQIRFDTETDHSQNREKEKYWESFIKNNLLKLQRWQS